MRIQCYISTILLFVVLSPMVVLGDSGGAAPIYQRWENAAVFRGQQNYSESEIVLRRIIADYQDDKSIEQRAWCELIFTQTLVGSIAGQENVTREAPTLGILDVPPTIAVPWQVLESQACVPHLQAAGAKPSAENQEAHPQKGTAAI